MGCCFSKKTAFSQDGIQNLPQPESFTVSCVSGSGISAANRQLAELPKGAACSSATPARTQFEEVFFRSLQDIKAITFTNRHSFKVTLFAFLSLVNPVDQLLTVKPEDAFPFLSFECGEELQWIAELWHTLVSAVRAITGPVNLINGELPALSKAMPWQVHEVIRGCLKASKQLTNHNLVQTLTQVGRLLCDSELTDERLIKELDYIGGFTVFK